MFVTVLLQPSRISGLYNLAGSCLSGLYCCCVWLYSLLLLATDRCSWSCAMFWFLINHTFTGISCLVHYAYAISSTAAEFCSVTICIFCCFSAEDHFFFFLSNTNKKPFVSYKESRLLWDKCSGIINSYCMLTTDS